MYILSLAVLKGVVSVCAIITDTGIYCHQRQFMQTAIYADDNSCNMYCRRRQFMQATIYAVTIGILQNSHFCDSSKRTLASVLDT